MSIYFHMDGMKWIYMAYQISLLLVSIINTNKYNFEGLGLGMSFSSKLYLLVFMIETSNKLI